MFSDSAREYPRPANEAMSPIKSICVYCGSGFGSDPIFKESAAALGRAMAEGGISLVYGGGNVGLMGTVARSVLDNGGYVTGIIPDFLKSREKMLDDVQETIVVPDMHTRKRLMFDKADAFVALPGGIGTLEELVEQMTWSQLGQHTKPILMLSIQGFWKPLLGLLAHMREQGFIREGLELNYLVAEQTKDVLPMLEAYARRVGIVENEELIEERF
ncbi:TIGR00730 family Rossman fold protein [Microvirga sp. BT291]|nr:TIGR00730 family Rossman fold protein [Microvirga pudoricolor]